MPTYTWASAAQAGDWSQATAAFPLLEMPIPDNARLVRVVVHNVFISASNSDVLTNYAMVPWFLDVSVYLAGGTYDGHNVFNTRRAFQQQFETTVVMAAAFVPVFNFVNTIWGADQEFGIDQGVSFGGVGRSAGTVTVQAGPIANNLWGLDPHISGKYAIGAKALYSL